MGPFIPKRTYTPNLTCYCQYCGVHKPRKQSFKLLQGPVTWWFCCDDHALEWLDHRHATPSINAFFHKTPAERAVILGEKSVDEYIADQLNLRRIRDAITADRVCADDLRNVHHD